MADVEDGSGRVVDWFAVLGCAPDADDTAVRHAYRTRARDSHPDRGGDPEEFARVNRAYELLRTAEQRAELVVRLRAQARRDRLQGGGVPGADGSAGPGGPAGSADPAGSGGPDGSRGRDAARPSGPPTPGGAPGPSGGGSRARDRGSRDAGRLSEAEQDRLMQQFWASHPDVTDPGAAPATVPTSSSRPTRRRGRGVRRVLLGAVLVVLLAFLAQPLLPQPVQDGLDQVVESVLP